MSGMNLNNYILQILKHFGAAENSFHLKLNEKDFVEINKDFINVNGQNIETKILYPNQKTLDTIDLKKVSNFLSGIKENIIGINHLGLSYSCINIEDELTYYKKLITGTSLKIFEEKSDSQNNRWFFLGNPEDNNPIFEIVLTESPTPIIDNWIPHFQIDFNTSLTYEAIVEKT